MGDLGCVVHYNTRSANIFDVPKQRQQIFTNVYVRKFFRQRERKGGNKSLRKVQVTKI